MIRAAANWATSGRHALLPCDRGQNIDRTAFPEGGLAERFRQYFADYAVQSLRCSPYANSATLQLRMTWLFERLAVQLAGRKELAFPTGWSSLPGELVSRASAVWRLTKC